MNRIDKLIGAVSAAKHTPGPWRYDPDGDFIWSEPSGAESPDIIADIRGVGPGLPIEANGLLIAAAPELLEALEMMLDRTTDPITDHSFYTLGDARAKADGAIRKARGEK